MTTLSIAELFKIDDKYFCLKLEPLAIAFAGESTKNLPIIVEDDVFIGIEVEVENINALLTNHLSDLLWTWHGDGSLRNGGMEAVSYPLKGKWIAHAINSLFPRLKNASFSPRTSIHVHLDVRALTQKQLTAIIIVYLAVESLLYKFVGRDRHDNIYCVPLYTTTIVNSLVDLLNKHILKQDFHNNRYAGLNLDGLRKFGTIEFRHLHGTHDVVKLVHWINLIFRIYQFAMRHDLDYLLTRVMELNTNSFYIAFINDVFGDCAGVIDLSDIKSDLEKGVKAVKQSVISNKFATELRKEFSRRSPAAQQYVKLYPHSGHVLRYFMESL